MRPSLDWSATSSRSCNASATGTTLPTSSVGDEGRFYARAALDPAYADPLALDCLVQVLLRGEGDPEVALLAEENRRRVAVAAMTGWAVHRRRTGR